MSGGLTPCRQLRHSSKIRMTTYNFKIYKIFSVREGYVVFGSFIVSSIPHQLGKTTPLTLINHRLPGTGCKEIILVLLKLNNSVKNYSFRKSVTPIQNRSDKIYVKCN